jgi:peptidyl-prolyl cis-trans isomerase SurA
MHRLLKKACLMITLAFAGLFASFPGLSRICDCAEVVDRIVAVVNDDIIQLSELNEAFAPYEAQIHAYGYSPIEAREIIYNQRMDILNGLIDDKLAEQEIQSTGIMVSEEEIDNAIEQIKDINRYTDEDFRRGLAATGLDMPRYRQEIKKQILRNKLVNYRVKSNIVITQTEINAYYDSHIEDYSPKKHYRLKNIMMPYPSLSDAETPESVCLQMENILAELAQGAPFEETAKKYSQAVNAADGGALGIFVLDELSENIQAAVQGMAAGEFSSIVETDQGYQIFYVEGIADVPGKSLEEASDEILRKLYDQSVNEKFAAWIEELRKNADIKIIR